MYEIFQLRDYVIQMSLCEIGKDNILFSQMNSATAIFPPKRGNDLEIPRIQAPRKILIVDDEYSVRVILKVALSSAGYAVKCAASGDEALILAAGERFDLVITDLNMPGQNGIETILVLRGREPNLRIIAMSGGGAAGFGNYLPLAATLGAVQTLAKPFCKEELLGIVRNEIGAGVAP